MYNSSIIYSSHYYFDIYFAIIFEDEIKSKINEMRRNIDKVNDKIILSVMESSNLYDIFSMFTFLSIDIFIIFFFNFIKEMNNVKYKNNVPRKNANPNIKAASMVFDDRIKIINAASIVITDVVYILRKVRRYALMFAKSGTTRLYVSSGKVGSSEMNSHFLIKPGIKRITFPLFLESTTC